jgi:hypothetical protein
VNGFYSSYSTVSIGKFNQLVATTGSTLGANYNRILFSNLVSPGVTPITFTLFDPPGPATQDAPFTIQIHGPNNRADLFAGSFLFGKDGSFTPGPLTAAQGVTFTSTLVPAPSSFALLVSGLGVLAWLRRAGRAAR